MVLVSGLLEPSLLILVQDKWSSAVETANHLLIVIPSHKLRLQAMAL